MAKCINVNMTEFKIEATEDGRVVHTITQCAFGRPGHLTPIIANGAISPTKRDPNHRSSIYGGAPMPFALFFEQDPTCAFHQGDVHTPSHGCIHLNHDDAKWLFDWAAWDPVALKMTGPYPTFATQAAKAP